MCKLLANRKIICSATMLVLLLSLTIPVQASGLYGHKEGMSQQSGEMKGRIGFLQKADKLVGTQVQNTSNEKIGIVKELIIDSSQKTVSYVIVSSERKLHPVSWSAFDTSGKTLMLNITKDKLMQGPSIESMDLLQLSNAEYRQRVDTFYSEQISAVQHRGAMEQAAEWMKQKIGGGERPDLCKLSEIRGLTIQNPQGEKLAKLSDVLIDVRHGTVAYGVVGIGGLMGIGGKTAIVPWAVLTVQSQTGIVKLDADRATLESAVLTREQMQQLTQAQFARELHEKFGAEPYWEVFGFVPGEGVEMSMAAWETGSKYNKSFEADKMTTAEGTIKSVGTFQPEGGSAYGLKLKVETKAGETFVVHCGPSQYSPQQSFGFKTGDAVTITGSKTRIGYQSVIIASEIHSGDRMLKLRDASGSPLWNVEEMRKQ